MSLLTLPGIFALFVSFGIGPLALKINKKYLLLFSVASTLIYFAILAFVGARGPFAALLVAAGILGISRGSVTALVNSIIGEFLEPAKRATNIALCSAIMQGGSGLMAILGGWIAAGNDGANWPISHLLGFLSIPTMIVFAIMMPKKPDAPEPAADDGQDDKTPGLAESSDAEKAFKKVKRSMFIKIFAIIALHFIFMICLAAYWINSSIYIIIEHELGTSANAGMVSSSYTLLAVFIGLSYRLWGKLFRKWIVPLGYALVALGLFTMLTVTTTIAGIWSAALMFGVGMNLANPYIVSQIMSLSPPKLMPVAISLYMGCMNLSMFLAPYILSFTGGAFGGGIVGSLRVATYAMPLCTVAAVFLFTLERKQVSNT
jgi:MFS family permease